MEISTCYYPLQSCGVHYQHALLYHNVLMFPFWILLSIILLNWLTNNTTTSITKMQYSGFFVPGNIHFCLYIQGLVEKLVMWNFSRFCIIRWAVLYFNTCNAHVINTCITCLATGYVQICDSWRQAIYTGAG